MKEKITSILFLSVIFGFSIFSLILKDKDISLYERRKLTNVDSLKEDFTSNLDDYLTDQFPLRDELISVNSTFDRYVLGNHDDNDVYIKDGSIIDKNYPLDDKSVQGFIKKINYINENYLEESNVFYTIIPDKSYFLDEKQSLKIDFNTLLDELKEKIGISYIDITDLVKLDDYYKTDIHLKQDSYFKIIKKLSNYLDFEYQELNYQQNKYDNFYGASYSKVPSFTKPDELIYFTNDTLNNLTVKHLEYGEKSIYDEEQLSGVDSYNVFLSGPSSLIEIENPNSLNDKELIIFRDSFGSSMTPFLVPYYKKITLVDLRYIRMDIATNYINFEDKDILFSYSTLLVNDSHLLKVDIK